jgi:phosphomannomutase
MFHPNIFRSYDIRGIPGEDFDAAFAQRLGSRVASYLKAGEIVVGHDGRASSGESAHAVIDGAMHVGAQVIDIGQVSGPQFHWAALRSGAVGGVMISEQGIAAVGHGGQVIGGHRLRQIYDGHPHGHSTGGTVDRHDIIPAYAAAVAQAAGWRGQELSLSLDAPVPVCRAVSLIASIAPDHRLAARFDASGECVNFFDQGTPIAADWIFLLVAERLANGPVMLDPRFSRAVREHLDERGISYTVGTGDREAPELTLLRVARIVAESGKTLTELVAPYPRYHQSQEMSIPVRDNAAALVALDRMAWYFGDGKASQENGLTIEYPDWWFTLRLSDTKPALTLVVEAHEKDLRDQKVTEVMRALQGIHA